jgi:hypothetical protein
MAAGIRAGGMMGVGRKAGESGKRCGQCLQRQQQQNDHGKHYAPAFHERVQSIENPKGLQ